MTGWSGLESRHEVVVQASPERVLAAFFDPRDLAEWWQVVRSVTIARPLGVYAVDWGVTTYRDDILGPLGGALHGTVIDYRVGVELFIADAFWSPPEGESIGPMALEVRCHVHGPNATRLTVRQSADTEDARWRRYFEIATAGWERSLSDLKQYLDSEMPGTPQ